jgi:Tfp pilus assembly protein PilF
VALLSHKRWTLMIGLAALVVLGWLVPLSYAGQDVYGSPPAQNSSFSGSVKQGFNKFTGYFSSKKIEEPPPTDDAISLKNQNKPGPQLYAAIARLYEDSGKFPEAEQYYQMALKDKPDDLAGLLGYARFQENQGRFNEAVTLYQHAIQTHPKEAGVYNNLGLCYSRRGKLTEAVQALEQAVQLDPRNVLYRNNLATVLIDQNRLTDAFACLREIHGDAVAYYNIGYLLNKKGQTEEAEHHFAQALRADPTMAPAQRWLNYLQNKSHGSPKLGQSNNKNHVDSPAIPSNFPAKIVTPQTPAGTTPTAISNSGPILVTSPAVVTPLPMITPQSTACREVIQPNVPAQSDAPPLPPIITSLKRLPPVSIQQSTGPNANQQESVFSTGSSQVAPLPPIVR